MTIRIRGWAAHRKFSIDATLVARSEKEMTLDTEDGHRVMLRPRYGNASIGSSARVYCHFFWDGEFVAIARLEEHGDGDVTVRPMDGTWSDDYQHVPDRP